MEFVLYDDRVKNKSYFSHIHYKYKIVGNFRKVVNYFKRNHKVPKIKDSYSIIEIENYMLCIIEIAKKTNIELLDELLFFIMKSMNIYNINTKLNFLMRYREYFSINCINKVSKFLILDVIEKKNYIKILREYGLFIKYLFDYFIEFGTEKQISNFIEEQNDFYKLVSLIYKMQSVIKIIDVMQYSEDEIITLILYCFYVGKIDRKIIYDSILDYLKKHNLCNRRILSKIEKGKMNDSIFSFGYDKIDVKTKEEYNNEEYIRKKKLNKHRFISRQIVRSITLTIGNVPVQTVRYNSEGVEEVKNYF